MNNDSEQKFPIEKKVPLWFTTKEFFTPPAWLVPSRAILCFTSCHFHFISMISIIFMYDKGSFSYFFFFYPFFYSKEKSISDFHSDENPPFSSRKNFVCLKWNLQTKRILSSLDLMKLIQFIRSGECMRINEVRRNRSEKEEKIQPTPLPLFDKWCIYIHYMYYSGYSLVVKVWFVQLIAEIVKGSFKFNRDSDQKLYFLEKV